MLRWEKLDEGMGFSRVGLILKSDVIAGESTHGLNWSWQVDKNYVVLYCIFYGPSRPETMWPDLVRLGLSPEQIQELKDDLPYYTLERQMESV